jgi:hypothetical protein
MSKTGTVSIKSSIAGNRINVTYTTIVNFVGDSPMKDQTREQERISEKLISDFIDTVKKDYKSAAGSSLKLKKGDSTDEIELLNMSPYNPKKTAYYRRRAVYTIGD